MNLFFRNFVFAVAFTFVAACAPGGNESMLSDEMMMGEEMMMADEGAGYGVLESSASGEDQWAALEVAAFDTPEAAAEFMASNGFDRARFDTNSSSLYWGSENALKAQARVLVANADLNIVIEGHADERGTDDYNLALGERRANSAREYLIAQGIDPLRIEVVSFGEERPVETCSDESCWSQNRRFVITIAGTGDAADDEDEDEGDVFDF